MSFLGSINPTQLGPIVKNIFENATRLRKIMKQSVSLIPSRSERDEVGKLFGLRLTKNGANTAKRSVEKMLGFKIKDLEEKIECSRLKTKEKEEVVEKMGREIKKRVHKKKKPIAKKEVEEIIEEKIEEIKEEGPDDEKVKEVEEIIEEIVEESDDDEDDPLPYQINELEKEREELRQQLMKVGESLGRAKTKQTKKKWADKIEDIENQMNEKDDKIKELKEKLEEEEKPKEEIKEEVEEKVEVEEKPNKKIIDEFKKLLQDQTDKGEKYKANTSRKVIEAVKKYGKKIEKGSDLKGIKGIGLNSIKRIDEIIEKGELEEVKGVEKKKDESKEELKKDLEDLENKLTKLDVPVDLTAEKLLAVKKLHDAMKTGIK